FPRSASCFRARRSRASCARAGVRTRRRLPWGTRNRVWSSSPAPPPASPTRRAPRRVSPRGGGPLPLSLGARAETLSPPPRLPRRPPHRRDQRQHRTADHHRSVSLGGCIMSLGSPLKQVSITGAAARLYWLRANIAWSLALFARPPKSAVTPKWRAPLRLAVGTLAGVVIVAATMVALDAPAVTAARQAPAWLIEFFDHITGYGKSVWFLVPIAVALTAIAGVASPSLPRMSQGVLAALAVRLGFLLLATGLPGLVFTVGKRLIGRARPFVEG